MFLNTRRRFQLFLWRLKPAVSLEVRPSPPTGRNIQLICRNVLSKHLLWRWQQLLPTTCSFEINDLNTSHTHTHTPLHIHADVLSHTHPSFQLLVVSLCCGCFFRSQLCRPEVPAARCTARSDDADQTRTVWVYGKTRRQQKTHIITGWI